MNAREIMDKLGVWPGAAYALAARRSEACRRNLHLSLPGQLLRNRLRQIRVRNTKQRKVRA